MIGAMARVRVFGSLVAAAATATVLAGIVAGPAGAASDAEQKIPSIELNGELSPAQADWIGHALGAAADAKDPFAIIRIDTPGGIDSSAQEIVDHIRSSPIPVVVYVYPPGASVADQGSSIVDAGDVAAMAPGTTIESDDNDLGENAALKQGRVDFIASDQDKLLEKLDGFEVNGPKPVTLSTAGDEIDDQAMTIPFQILEVLVNPNVAFLLLLIGILGIALEAFAPGTIIPGAIGAVALVLGLIGALQLPIAAVGAVLLIVGAALVIAETNVASAGVLGVLGVVAVIAGGLLIFDTGSDQIEVSPAFVIVVGAVLGLGTVWVGNKGLQARHRPVVTGREELLGAIATVRAPLDPTGQVFVQGALWEARVDPGVAPVETGYRVRVEEIDGLELAVTPLEDGPAERATGAVGSEAEGAS